MTQGKLQLSTKSNTEGRLTVRRRVPEMPRNRDAAQDEGVKGDSNPRHREDFKRLLKGMARNSE